MSRRDLPTLGTIEGIHIRSRDPVPRNEIGRKLNYSVYELYSKDVFMCSIHGPCALMAICLVAKKLFPGDIISEDWTEMSQKLLLSPPI